MAKTIHGTCVYCGDIADLTKDHVIPQCLFSGSIPIGAPKVWACEPCNSIIKSGLDTYLRDMLVTDMHSSRSPEAQKIIPKFHRAVKRNQSKFVRDMLQHSRLVELITPTGLYAGQGFAPHEAKDKTLEILSMYVRGLHAFYVKKALPKDIEFPFFRAGISAEVNHMIQTLNREGTYAGIGNGDVFECLFGHARDVPEAGVWVLSFMRRAVFIMFVVPKNLSQQPIENSPVDK